MSTPSTWYVSPQGNNSNSGNVDTLPLLTLVQAIVNASNGDTIYLMNGSHIYTSTININKELTIRSQNGKDNVTLTKTNGGDFFSIQSNNVTITDLTIQASATNTADSLISISRQSDGTTLPTKYSNINITNNNLKMFKFGVTINGGNITVTGNTFSRNGGTERLTLILVYYIRDTITIYNNTHTDTLRTQRFVYLTGAGTTNSLYGDRVNSKGGNLIINNNTINTSANTTQKPVMFIQDYYNTYNYGNVGSNDDYNLNTKLDITMDSNNMIGNSTMLCDFFATYFTLSTNLISYSKVTLTNNTVSHSNVGILKLDAPMSLTIPADIIELQYLFYINSNTITNFTTRSDFVGNQTVSQNSSGVAILPANIYLLTTFISSAAPKQNQTITFNTLAPQTYSLNGVINLSGSSNSGLLVTYASSNTNVVEVSESTLIIKGVGQVNITASQAGNVNYNAATPVEQIQEITEATPTLSEFSIPTKTVGDAMFKIQPPSSNNTDPDATFSYTSSDTLVATISGDNQDEITIVGAGTTTITATQIGSGNYGSGTIETTFQVLIKPTLSDFSIPTKTFGDAMFKIQPPSSNNTDPDATFSYTSSDTLVATISGDNQDEITIVGAGTTTITATQAGSGNYGSGTIETTFQVLIKPTLSKFSIPTKTFGDAMFKIQPPSSNNTDPDATFSYVSANVNVATISGDNQDEITIVGVGTTTITATQAGSGNYGSGTIETTFQVLIKPTLSEFSIPTKTFGDAMFKIQPPSSNNTDPDATFSYVSANVNVATISGENQDEIKINGTGKTIITATQRGSGNYGSGTIETTFQVYPPSLPPPPKSNIWKKLGEDIDGENEEDNSGRRVSLSADGLTVAIGASANDGNGSSSGHVRVYKYLGTSWVKLGQDIDGENPQDGSGNSVSLSGDGLTVAIGATANNGNDPNSYKGHVRVYKYSGSSWTKLGEDIDGENPGDFSGSSVSLSANGLIVAIGAGYNRGDPDNDPDNDPNFNPLFAYKGHVRVYKYSDNSWIKLGQDIDGENPGDFSGNSVSLSANGLTVAIGATGNDGNGSSSGHVRVYKYLGTSWIKLGQDIDGENPEDGSGRSVSLSGDGLTVAIGAPSNRGDSSVSYSEKGHVRVYKYSGSSWSQLGEDIDGENPRDGSGDSVSLSGDGLTVAIGAPGNAGDAGNVPYLNTGHVRVYKYSSSSWTLVGDDIDGEYPRDESGSSVSLSEDGLTVAIGAPFNRDSRDGDPYSSKGQVRVYKTLSDKKTPNELLNTKSSISEILAAGYKSQDLIDKGITAAQMKENGYNVKDLRQLDFPVKQMKEAKFPLSSLLTARFSLGKLVLYYSADKFLKIGLDSEKLRKKGVSNQRLRRMGFKV